MLGFSLRLARAGGHPGAWSRLGRYRRDVEQYVASSPATRSTAPAYIPVGALDLFLDENIEYVQRLMQAGVPTELHVYPGAFHGFDMLAPSAAVSKQFKTERDQALNRALQ